jgi:probable F420-dependent oxidoreductase
MRISLALPFDQPVERLELIEHDTLIEMARAAEEAEIGACYVTDHPFPTTRWHRGGGHHTLDPMLTLSFVAAATQTLRLHTNCFIPAYRNPFLAAKAVATLDQLSGGRIILGVAAGYLKAEFAGLGVPLGGRGALLDETIETMRRAWRGEEFHGVSGRHVHAGNVVLPRPIQEGGPPIWIGGNSAAAMKRAARYGDGWVPFPATSTAATAVRTVPLTDIHSLATRLREFHALREELGRQTPVDICFTPFNNPTTHGKVDAASLLDEALALHDLGVTWLAIQLPVTTVQEFHDQLAQLAEQVVRHLPDTPPR